MARKTNRLTALAVSRAKAKGMYPDGAGLYLHVSEGGAASWIYSYMFNRRPREMGYLEHQTRRLGHDVLFHPAPRQLGLPDPAQTGVSIAEILLYCPQ